MRRLLLACAAIALLACGGDATGAAASAEGTWNLQTVNGATLPFTAQLIASENYKLEILADQFVLNGNGTYNEFFTTRQTQGTQVTTSDATDNGTWTQHGSEVDLTAASDRTTLNATINGNRITANPQGFLLVYIRQ